MADRYDIVKTGRQEARWKITRTDDDPEFGFVKDVGFFDRKSTAEWALAQIKANPDMNFAEWFFTQSAIYGNEALDVSTMQKYCYKLWRAFSGHYAVDQVRERMGEVMALAGYVAHCYEERIDDIEMGHAAQMAGDSW